ncbi:hypothetical protein NESM_000426800 [Novymonas esmeraldas]|uniref:Uncharacterized protein n=1 Tax=Novymonas esmeraldas TaxID=1808958 RepID=A0AAW0ELP4_9TRYP
MAAVAPHTASPLCALEAKYEAVLAENEELSHRLRAEQRRRRHLEDAQRRIQKDVKHDQQRLQRLFTEAEERVGGATSSPSADERVRSLEQTCAYLQAKVESLQVALAVHERGGDHNTEDNPHQDALSTRKAEGPPREEHAVRRRADSELAHCHAELRRLADDAAHKEVFFYQQLAALQAQNAALLDDIDTWVTAEQHTHVAAAFATRTTVAAPSAATHTPTTSQKETAAAAATSVDVAAELVSAAALRQLQQHIEGQEALLEVKDRSIAQLEARVRELERALAATPTMADLQRSHRAATALTTSLSPHAAALAARGTFIPTPTSASSTAATADTPSTILHDIVAVLRFSQEVVSRLPPPGAPRAAPSPPSLLHGHCRSTDRVYPTGESLADAAQHLAGLMRRHASPKHTP